MYFELNRHPAQVPRTKIDFCPPTNVNTEQTNAEQTS